MLTVYTVSYKLRNDIKELAAAESAVLAPKVDRVKASNATRAIAAVVSKLREEGAITGKKDVVILEVKVTV